MLEMVAADDLKLVYVPEEGKDEIEVFSSINLINICRPSLIPSSNVHSDADDCVVTRIEST